MPFIFWGIKNASSGCRRYALLRHHLKVQLRESGHQVDAAEDAKEADYFLNEAVHYKYGYGFNVDYCRQLSSENKTKFLYRSKKHHGLKAVTWRGMNQTEPAELPL